MTRDAIYSYLALLAVLLNSLIRMLMTVIFPGAEANIPVAEVKAFGKTPLRNGPHHALQGVDHKEAHLRLANELPMTCCIAAYLTSLTFGTGLRTGTPKSAPTHVVVVKNT